MMKRYVILISLIITCFTTVLVKAQDIKEPAYNFTVSSPIYRSQTEKIDLDFIVPKHFKPVQTAAQAAKLHLLQFIPQDETPQVWTQLVVLQILGNQSIDAAQFTEMIEQKVKAKANTLKELTKNTKSEDKYLTSTLGLYYETGGRREISYMRYYSSPGHLSGIQYVRALKPDDQPEKIIQEMIVNMDKFSKVTTKPINKPPELNVFLENAFQ